MLRADAALRARAEIGLERRKHRSMTATQGMPSLRHPSSTIVASARIDQRVEHDAGRFLDLLQRLLGQRLRAHHRVDVLDRMAVLVLGGSRAPDGNQRLAGRVGHEMQMKITLCDHGSTCGVLSSAALSSRIPGSRDTAS